MTHGSLFSGIGGFDLAAEWAGWENKFHCEWNEFGQRVLNYYWPDAVCYGDITKTDFTVWRGRIDVLTGGFPCQPYSMAGKRLGKEDERHLWPEMLRAIREIQPRYVVGENVPGLINWSGGLVFEEVQSDLEAAGYEVIPFILPAAGVNAPHRRERVWFVAYSESNGSNRTPNETSGKIKRQDRNETKQLAECSEIRTTTNTESFQKIRRRQSGFQPIVTGSNAKGIAPNAESQQSERLQPEQRELSQQEQGQLRRTSGEMDYRNASNTSSTGLQWQPISGSTGCIRKESDKQPTRFFRTEWEDFPTVSPIHERNDGISDRLSDITFSKWRNESVKACGNAIVPQVAYQIFKTINEYECGY